MYTQPETTTQQQYTQINEKEIALAKVNHLTTN